MADYYELLGIEKTADAQQIKRAYFKQVRQYPPERFPEEFKALRAAYETLSDGKKRVEYDKADALPAEVRKLFENALLMQKQSRYEQAELLLRTILKSHPELSEVKAELAHLYEKMEKSGKAITIWEELCALEQNHVHYNLGLARSYAMRGWRKKAIERYKRVILLDSGNTGAWTGLLKCHAEADEWDAAHKISLQALDAVKKTGREDIYLYSTVCVLNLNHNSPFAEECLRDIERLLRDHPDTAREDGEATVKLLLGDVMRSRNFQMLPHIQNMADILPYVREDLRTLLANANIISEIETICEKGFSDLFHDLFATLHNQCDCEDCRNDMVAMECHILAEPDMYRPQLLRLKKDYPQLYALHDTFFDEALLTRNPEKMLYKRLKTLSKSGIAPTFYQNDSDDDEMTYESQPSRREAPKIGRNDPCPCGSGKKYKKCCGV